MLEKRRLAFMCLAFVILTIGMSGTGCRFLPLPDRYLKVLPSREEMVGKWTIDAQSIKRMKLAERFSPMSKLKSEDHLIVLRADGTCSFRSYAIFHSDSDYIVSEGRWELLMEEPVEGYVGKQASVEMTLTPTPNHIAIARFTIVRENDKLVMWQYIGDPDGVKYADFHKVPA